MTWAEKTITDAGLILLQEALDGKAFTVVFAAAGTGYKESMQLASQTAIEEQIIGLDCKIVENNNLSSGPGREIVVQITNLGMTEATRIKQVGIYAKTDGDPVLFAVVQDSDGCIVPAEDYIGGYKLRLKFGVPISATENITVITTPEGTASKEELANAINKSVEISSRQTPAVGVKTHYYVLADVPYTPHGFIPEGVESGYISDESGETIRASVNSDAGIENLALKLD